MRNPNNPLTSTGQYVTDAMGSALNASRAVYQGGFYWVLLSVALYAFDWFVLRFNGIPFKTLLTEINSNGGMWLLKAAINAVVLIVIIAYWLFGRHNREEILSMGFAIMITSIIFSLVGFDKGPLFHLVFAWSMMFFLFYKAMPRQDAHILLIIVLIIDFFAFSLLSLVPGFTWANRLIIPIYFLISLNYCKESWLKNTLVFLVIIFYVLQVASTAYDVRSLGQTFGDNEKMTTQKSVMNAWNNFIKFYKNLKNESVTKINQDIDNTKKDISGESYVTEVDARSKQDLGISFYDFKSFSQSYTEGNDITLGGTLRGKSIDSDKSVQVFINCTATTSTNPKKVMIGEIKNVGSEGVNIGLTSEKYIECKFKNATKGYWTIKIQATFNYTSQAYLKTYFVNQNHYKLLYKNDKTKLFTAEQISEINPISKSVNGPGKVGIVTLEPPTVIPEDKNEFNSYVGISVTNNWPNGRLKSLNFMRVTIPDGLEMNCDDRFEIANDDYENKEKTYQLKSDYLISKNKLPIINAISEKCAIKLSDKNTILENNDFMMKYIKSDVNYEYLLKKEVSLSVKAKPIEPTKTVATTTTTTSTTTNRASTTI